MAILITGAGMVGTYAAKLLAEAGVQPVLFELAPNRAAIAAILDGTEVPIVQGDIADVGLLVRTLRAHDVSAVIHSAGLLTAASQQAPLRAVQVNVGGTAALLDACRTAGVTRMVFCSSVLAYYGMLSRAEAPIPGDFTMRASSERPPLVYAATKLACEHIGAAFAELAGLEFVALRFGAVFGPWFGDMGGVTGRVFRTLAEQVRAGRIEIRDPNLMWQGQEDFTYAKDAARAVVAAATYDGPVQGAHNITMAELVSFADVLGMIRELRPAITASVQVDDPGGIAGFKFQRSVPNDVSSATEFGWIPKYGMKAALEDYFDWIDSSSLHFQANPELKARGRGL